MSELAGELPSGARLGEDAGGAARLLHLTSVPADPRATAAPGSRATGTLRSQLEALYDSHHERLFVCALAVTRCPDLAEDAIHDAFCRLLLRPEAPRDLRVYVFRSVRNAAIDLLRKGGRMVELEGDFLFDPAPGPRRAAESAEFQHRVSLALQLLSDDERETIVQHLYADLTFREIADLRENSINTVMSWYRRGQAKLRAHLED
jgi:RNA polymerase sigma-70 factor (ECF subfamily)